MAAHRLRTRAAAALVALLLASCARERRLPPAPAPGLGVTFFDVGQADAALLRTAEGKTVVIDTGHNGEIVPLLRGEGVTRIDLLILSHSHADHTGGFAAVARSFPVAETWYAGVYGQRLARALAARNARVVAAGTAITLGRLSLTVLHPEPGAVPDRRDEAAVNNGSIVVKAVYGDSRYLFPGDCELGCWEELFRRHRPDLRADVLKAAHHGSWNGTNSGVLGNVRPQTFVISCGRENRYGHPHPVVLKLVEKLGARLFRTDVQGSIRCAGSECRATPSKPPA